MVKHDCEICRRTHGNQVYAVADLKRRVFRQKCHADRSQNGAEIPFPPLPSMARVEETEAFLQPYRRRAWCWPLRTACARHSAPRNGRRAL
jgi:hypothetical protein